MGRGGAGGAAKRPARRRNKTDAPGEEALRGYAFTFNSITEAVSVVDPAMRYVMVNDAWCRFTGIAREAALGRVAFQVLGRSTFLTDERRAALDACLQAQRVTRVTSVHVGADGVERHLETTHTPYRGAAGELLGAVLTTRDVTAERRMIAMLQASEAQQRALLAAFPGFIAAIDEDLRYTYVNEGVAQLFGLPAERIVGRTTLEILGAEAAAQVEREVREAFAGRPTRAERHYAAGRAGVAPGAVPLARRIDLEVLHVAGPPPPDGRRVCYVFGVDVTERVMAQDAQRSARDEAEQANRAKSRFLAQMSHELRTPLHAISGFAQLLAGDPRAPLDARQADCVREIQHGAQHLLELINEVLDLGRIEAGRLRLQLAAVPLPALLGECHALAQPLARERAVHLREPRLPAGEPAVRADRMRLKQVLLNLLANATKYNRRDGEVELAVEPARRADGRPLWRLVVRDTGPGLDAAARSRLFTPFERLGAERGGVEGTGIGLALSRGLVLAMGGEIGVESTPGEGSRFWVDLPAEGAADLPADLPPAATAAPTRGAPATATVLHVDDNPVNLVLMDAMLARLAEGRPGLRVRSAATAAEALRLASTERPQLVLLDIQLPDLDGFEVLARLRAAPGTADVPVVAVSANAMPADIAAAHEAGFADYLTKPLDMARLHATVQRLLDAQAVTSLTSPPTTSPTPAAAASGGASPATAGTGR